MNDHFALIPSRYEAPNFRLCLLPLVLSIAGLLTSATLTHAAGSAPPLMLAKL
jgi:hypothetical protein